MSVLFLVLWITAIIIFYFLYITLSYSIVSILFISALCLYLYIKSQRRLHKVFLIGFLIASVVSAHSFLRLEFLQFGEQKQGSYGHIESFVFDANEAAQKINDVFLSFTSKDAAGFFTALITGRRTYLHYAMRDIVRRSGISHLLALSGFHLSVLLFLLASIQFAMTKKMFYFGSLIAVWIYCLWIGFIPSLWRASIMYSINVLGIFFIGKGRFSISWSVAGLTMVLFSPQTLLAPGFMLSMLALAGVVWGGRFYSKVFDYYIYYFLILMRKVLPYKKNIYILLKNILEYVLLPFAVSIGAALSTAWYSMLIFKTTYPVGIAVSVILTPVVVLFMALGIVLLVLVLIPTAFVPISFITRGIGLVLEYLMNGIRITSAYASSLIDITSWNLLVAFYIILVVICVPYVCAKNIQTIKEHSNYIYVLFKKIHTAIVRTK